MHLSKQNFFKSKKGLNKEIVIEISEKKNEPGWMTDFRLKALGIFEQKPMPTWGADLSELDINDIYYYLKPIRDKHTSWDEVPDRIKETFDKLGIPKAEQNLLAGVGAQFESEVIYKNLKQQWRDLGVIFTDTDSALKEFPEIFKKYFSTIIPPTDNKFAALNSAVWSGGSFVYVPNGVKVDLPLQAYFRINAQSMGQFERTLIVCEPGSFVHYIEGCSAPVYSKSSLHSAVVEVIALENSHVRYTTIQNWSENVYNLVTKRAIADKNAKVEWVDGNFGSKVTMKYPCIILKGEGSKGQIISLAVAGKNQVQDAGGKVIHLAPKTTSSIISKSISKNGGRASYRGLLKVIKNAKQCKSRVQCDALIFDNVSRSDTYPTVDVREPFSDVGHEASVSKINDVQLFYLMSRGLSEQEARAMIVNGFIDCFVSELPMEYAIEINRLIAMEMEDSIG
ncbi:Fe-S cluster assembly protein SufB [candidate division TM6 bacterium RIFCSPHIGHO2_12_FULL_32_22]|nr:MAG: Fe-S cluster assembly protein SufB [candidate division TM6 bacterium RIFCSPHIGHO2_12_FULL_32_22]